MRKLLFISTILIATVLTACGSGGSGPTDAAISFYHSIEAGKNNDAYQLISKQSRDKYGENSAAVKVVTDRIEDKRTRQWTIKTIISVEETVTAESSKVEIKIQYGGDFIDEDKLEMVNEEGSWRIKSSMLLDKLIAAQ